VREGCPCLHGHGEEMSRLALSSNFGRSMSFLSEIYVSNK